MAVTLKLNGGPLVVALPSKDVARKFFDSKPGEVFTLAYLATALNIAETTLKTALIGMRECTYKIGATRYYGHPKAIAELRRQVSA